MPLCEIFNINAIREELKSLLEGVPYRVTAPEPDTDLIELARKEQPDLLLLDIGLPGTDGLTICSRLRKESRIPVIFVTARNTSMDELNCLLRGGDDFVAKPYQPAVLLARIAAVLRRTAREQDEALIWKNVRLDLACGTGSLTRELAVRGYEMTGVGDGRSTELSRNELKILYFLMKHAGKIVSREDLIDYLWDQEVFIDDNALSVNMTRLRGRLEDIGAPGYIETRRGLGYQI